MATNASSNILAALLADAKVGTFTGLVVTKVGKELGPKDAKVRYGDDTVHVCLFTGFKYEGLVRRSLAALNSINLDNMLLDAAEDGVVGWEGRGKAAFQRPLTAADFAAAKADLVASFERTLDPAQESTSTTAHVFEPLVVDGEVVRGGRVYQCVAGDSDHECKCRNCTGNKKAPLPGTINLQGLQVSSRVLEPAVNGPIPASKSAAKTVAKDLLTYRLPISRYRSYRLEPGTPFLLRVGGTAKIEAEQAGIVFTPDMRDAIQRSVAA